MPSPKIEVKLDKGTDWDEAKRILTALPPLTAKALQMAILREGHEARKLIIAEFSNGAPYGGGSWAPLSKITLAIRLFEGFSGTKTLVVSGSLKNSVQVIEQDGGVFIGVSRNAPRQDGKDPVNIALVQEFGASYSVTMTPKMSRYLFAALAAAGLSSPRTPGPRVSAGGAGGHVIKITIPARPFIMPVFDSLDPAKITARIAQRMAGYLSTNLGRKLTL